MEKEQCGYDESEPHILINLNNNMSNILAIPPSLMELLLTAIYVYKIVRSDTGKL